MKVENVYIVTGSGYKTFHWNISNSKNSKTYQFLHVPNLYNVETETTKTIFKDIDLKELYFSEKLSSKKINIDIERVKLFENC